MMDGLEDENDIINGDSLAPGRAETVDLTDNSLVVDISDALSEKDKVKFTVHTKTTLPEFQQTDFYVVRQHEEFVWLHDRFEENEDYAGYIDNEHTSHGERFREAVAECCRVNPAQLVAVGVNCLAPAQVTPLLTSVHSLDASGHVPFIVYPNSGETWQSGVGWTNKEACQPLVQYLPEWISLGVQFIGGCCRINADDIKQCRKYLDSHPS